MDNVHKFLTYFLIFLSIIIIINSLFTNDESYKTIINIIVLVLVLIIGIAALIIRFNHNSKHK